MLALLEDSAAREADAASASRVAPGLSGSDATAPEDREALASVSANTGGTKRMARRIRHTSNFPSAVRK
jgi:hypothetical protein